jgi:hypothetical protein
MNLFFCVDPRMSSFRLKTQRMAARLATPLVGTTGAGAAFSRCADERVRAIRVLEDRGISGNDGAVYFLSAGPDACRHADHAPDFSATTTAGHSCHELRSDADTAFRMLSLLGAG